MPNVLTPSEKFQHRCEARAILWQLGDVDLHQAIDALEVIRLALQLDADEAQRIMSAAFALVRHD